MIYLMTLPLSHRSSLHALFNWSVSASLIHTCIYYTLFYSPCLHSHRSFSQDKNLLRMNCVNILAFHSSANFLSKTLDSKFYYHALNYSLKIIPRISFKTVVHADKFIGWKEKTTGSTGCYRLRLLYCRLSLMYRSNSA